MSSALTGVGEGNGGPVIEYATSVTYPSDSGVATPGPLIIVADGLDMAQKRAKWHRSNGARADVVQRAWTASPWKTLAEESL